MRRVNLGLTRLRMRPVRRLARATSGGAPRPTGRTRCGSSPVLVGLLEVGLEDVRKGWARGACRWPMGTRGVPVTDGHAGRAGDRSFRGTERYGATVASSWACPGPASIRPI